MTTNVTVRDLDLVGPRGQRPEAGSGRERASSFCGESQLPIDTTLVSAMPRMLPAEGRHNKMGWPPNQHANGKRDPTLSCQDLTAELHLVVLALRVGGRWSEKMQAFLTQLARAKSTRRNAVDATGVTSLVGLVNGVFCGSGCGFNHAGVAWCSRL